MKGKNTENVFCNFCGEDNAEVLYKRVTSWEHVGVFTVVKCRNCSLIYVNPRPIQSKIGLYYPARSYWGDDVTKENDNNYLLLRQKSYGYLYEQILLHKKKGAVLDIGAGTGLFLSYFKELGFKTEGVEFSPDASKYALKMFGVKLRVGDFLQKKFAKNSYDVVTLNNSLEHLYDPLKTLVELNKVTKKGGILVVTVPNIDSVGFKLFKSNWYALQPPRHLYHFTESTLTEMLTQAGFRNIKIKRGYFTHNYNTLFESIRLSRSEKFKKSKRGGVKEVSFSSSFSLKKEVFKAVARIIAYVLSLTGTITHNSEVITVIAHK